MLFLSETQGTKGSIKGIPEDFVVKEITSKGTILEPSKSYSPEALGEQDNPAGKATRFVLQKTDWDTVKVLMEIADRRGRGRKSIGYSGIKDKASVSVQLASIYGVTPDQVSSVRINGVSINGAWRGEPLELGSNIGNGFEARVREAGAGQNAPKTIEELGGVFPNYFDRQRFGYRFEQLHHWGADD